MTSNGAKYSETDSASLTEGAKERANKRKERWRRELQESLSEIEADRIRMFVATMRIIGMD